MSCLVTAPEMMNVCWPCHALMRSWHETMQHWDFAWPVAPLIMKFCLEQNLELLSAAILTCSLVKILGEMKECDEPPSISACADCVGLSNKLKLTCFLSRHVVCCSERVAISSTLVSVAKNGNSLLLFNWLSWLLAAIEFVFECAAARWRPLWLTSIVSRWLSSNRTLCWRMAGLKLLACCCCSRWRLRQSAILWPNELQ